MNAVWRVDHYFNPLPSYEGRRVKLMIWRVGSLFQSTPLTRGETSKANDLAGRIDYFNPLPSYEGRPYEYKLELEKYEFQSTPLTRGETLNLSYGS